jgi:hypothetical protein
MFHLIFHLFFRKQNQQQPTKEHIFLACCFPSHRSQPRPNTFRYPPTTTAIILIMHGATTVITFALFLASAQAFAGISGTSRNTAFATTTSLESSPLDGMNREILNLKDDDDDDVPMTKAEMREAAKEMKAEMKRLKEEAAAAAKKEE